MPYTYKQYMHEVKIKHLVSLVQLPMGRKCIEHYRDLHRQCVFSHEELICKMAADPDNLDFKVAASTYEDLLTIADTEKQLRKNLLQMVCFNSY